MMIKGRILWLLPLCFLVSSCASQSSLMAASGSDSNSFENNPRVIFQDLTTPKKKRSSYPSKKPKKVSSSSAVSASRDSTTNLAVNTPLMGTYNESVNDRFNGVTSPVPVAPTVIKQATPVLAGNSQPSAPVSVNAALGAAKQKPASEQPSQANQQLTPLNQQPVQPSQAGQQITQQDTTYIPLTFPVPPPKSMMQQFNMKVGGESGNNDNN